MRKPCVHGICDGRWPVGRRSRVGDAACGGGSPAETRAERSVTAQMAVENVRWSIAARANPTEEWGMADDLLVGTDVLIGVSGPGAVSKAAVRRMAARPVVFAMANRLRRSATTSRSWPPVVRTTRIKSTTCWPSPVSSAARWTSRQDDQRRDEARRHAGHRWSRRRRRAVGRVLHPERV